MNFREELLWILDKKGKRINEEDEYQQNIDFVHSLGRKCDCVGWSKLKTDEPDTDNILNEIKAYCKTNGWEARGWYTRTYCDITSDWFELETTCFNDTSIADWVCAPTDAGGEIELAAIRAYHELSPAPKKSFGICVSERFRNACIKHGIEGVDFCWVQDKGRYAAEQYFYIYADKLIPRVACDRGLKKSDKAKINALGGYLPKIADVFSELQHISLPNCYLAEDMPYSGIAHVYCPSTNSYNGQDIILIHKDTAEILVNEKALSRKDLKPVPVLNTCPGGYTLDKTQAKQKPSQSYISQMLTGYKKLKTASRPAHIISEKDAMKIFRKTKAERKDDFNKRISKGRAEAITGTQYKQLLPYYLIANGGYLSDEYRFLSYEESVEATIEFSEQLKAEELLACKPEGIVFSKCADGDVVILLPEGSVIRFSHEAPETANKWQSVAQFIFDTINENERMA